MLSSTSTIAGPIILSSSSYPLYQLYLFLVMLINFKSVVEFNFWAWRPHESNFLMIQYGTGRTVTFLIFKMRPVFSSKTNREPWIFPVVPKKILLCFLDSMVLVMYSLSCASTYDPKMFTISDRYLSEIFCW